MNRGQLGFSILITVITLIGSVSGCRQSPETPAAAGSLQAEAPSIEQETAETSALPDELRAHVVKLAETIGQRNPGRHRALEDAARYIEDEFRKYGFEPQRQVWQVNGMECANVIATLAGSTGAAEIVVVGAHYDSVAGSPGANDNASGVASLLAIAKRFAGKSPHRTIRFVAFANEEPPYFQNEGQMGSWVYARHCREQQENIVAAISLETMGWFSDAEGSQQYPPPLDERYPSTGNFIALVANVESTELVRKCFTVFRENSDFPVEFGALPGDIPGVGWSDHWSFWQEGYAGVMVTDTAVFRYPHYHKATDTPDKVDYGRLARVVDGLVPVVSALANP